jgi:hypothetical protein
MASRLFGCLEKFVNIASAFRLECKVHIWERTFGSKDAKPPGIDAKAHRVPVSHNETIPQGPENAFVKALASYQISNRQIEVVDHARCPRLEAVQGLSQLVNDWLIYKVTG